jgi:hypothetical protein
MLVLVRGALGFIWAFGLFRLPLRAGHEFRQWLQEQREKDGRHHVGLSHSKRGEAEEIPQLA